MTGALSMGGESVERLMEIILQMKINMAHINETMQQQTFEICQELSTIFKEQKAALDGYLGAIDVKLKKCSSLVDEYERLYAALAEMRGRLEQMGAAPSPLPDPLPSDTLEGILEWRVRRLIEQGKM